MAITSKGAEGGGRFLNFGSRKILKLTLDILVLQMKSKKKVLGALNGSLVGGGNSLFNFFKGGNLKKKVWETLV